MNINKGLGFREAPTWKVYWDWFVFWRARYWSFAKVPAFETQVTWYIGPIRITKFYNWY